jgi:hypothetical protein
MNWAAIFKTGLSIASVVVPQINVIEQLAKSVPSLRGKAKEDAVVTLSEEILSTAEQAAGKDLLNDAGVQAATRSFIQSYVALQNVVARKQQTVGQ